MVLKHVGYLALIREFDLKTLPHFQVSFIAEKGQRKTHQLTNGQVEEIYPKSYDPGAKLCGQLEFALKYEGINLEILSELFAKIDPAPLVQYILSRKTGKNARKLWFLYEFLSGKKLTEIPDLKTSNYIELLDKDKYYSAESIFSRRHRIYNNLLGDKIFSPMVRKTALIKQYESQQLNEKSAQIIRRYPEDVIARAVHFLYTKETRSSYQIEKEEPDQTRISRFVDILKAAGSSNFLTHEKLVQLQNQIVDERFCNQDYRNIQNYVGETIGLHRQIIHYIPPKPDSVPSLMEGLIRCHQKMQESSVSAVIDATVTSFGFVFIHPFEDGNGRIHRFLIHHVLSTRGFTPEGVVFPVSATLLRKIRKYDEALEVLSKPLMPLLRYTLDNDGTMQVVDDTAKYYRFIDMTQICESMFGFLSETIDTDFLLELDFLVHYDRTKKRLQETVDMSDQKLDQFIKFCIQNNGHLSTAKREKFFYMLSSEEIARLETIVRENIPGEVKD